MGGVEVDDRQGVVLHAAGQHEAERPLDLTGHLLVAMLDARILHEAGIPGVQLPDVGETAGDEGPHQVQGGGRRVVHLYQAIGIVAARFGGEVEAVDGIAAVGGQCDGPARFGVLGAGLGVLAGDASDLDDRNLRGVRQHHAHGQQDPKLGFDVVCAHAVEGLSTVAALQNECLAIGDPGDLVAQIVAFARKNKRR